MYTERRIKEEEKMTLKPPYYIYAEDFSARESATTIKELERQTVIVIKLYKVMRDSRLAVNNDNTQIMCIASARKRRAL